MGWGEAAPLPGHAEASLDDVEAELVVLAGAWQRKEVSNLRQTPDDVDVALQDLAKQCAAGRHASAAFGTALAALMADIAGIPLAAWLEPATSPSVAVNTVITGGSLDDAVAKACAAVRDGFRTLKLKVGFVGETGGLNGAAQDGDFQRVQAVRSAVGPAVAIRLDANGVWTTPIEALSQLEAFEPFDIEYLEQPVPAGDIASLREVRAHSGIPIAADEALLVDGGAEQVATAEAADVWILKPTLCGGVLEARRLARLAKRARAKVVVTSALESGVGRTAALHVAAAFGSEGIAHGLATGGFMTTEDVAVPWEVADGMAMVTLSPGLGLAEDAASSLEWRDIDVK